VVGADTTVLGHIYVFPQSGRVHIRRKCFIGEASRIWSNAEINIGDYVLISYNVSIHDNVSHPTSWRQRRAELDQSLPHLASRSHAFDLKGAPVVIEHDVG
jgi:acetyltransferase-like isoleucine patch superfamily enzyme